MQEDITLGRQLATGAFGTVYKATLQLNDGSSIPVVVKKAKEFGEAEVWMKRASTPTSAPTPHIRTREGPVTLTSRNPQLP
jgi:hypothetical protein